jgi:hypothetical protein
MAEPPEKALLHGVARHVVHDIGDALDELEHDASEQAFADDDVGAALGDVAALDVAGEVDARIDASRSCASDSTSPPLNASDPMLAARRAAAPLSDPVRVGASHDGELHQIRGVAAHGRSDVEQQRERILAGMIGVPRIDARERRLPDALIGSSSRAHASRHAPVLPALTSASAWPSRTSAAPTRIEASRFARKASRGGSCMPTASPAWWMRMWAGS